MMEPQIGIISCKNPASHPPTRHLNFEVLYLSIYWSDIYHTLNVDTYDYLEQEYTVTVAFVHATFVQN